MRTFLLSATAAIMSFTSLCYAESSGIWSDGVVTYKHPNGSLVDRDCQLFVPARGQGEAVLKCGQYSTPTSEFKTEKENGQTIFTVLFRNPAGAPAGSIAKFKGSYLRGSNRAIYYGDVFSSSSAQASLDTNEYFQYSGGFKFSKSIATAAEVASSDLTTPVLPGDVTTVPFVDLSRYVGKWYEMASFPQSFQRGCVASTADYSLNSDGTIKVVNQCRIDTLDGRLKTAVGTAKVVDTATNSKLKVTFFWPFSGDYWIVDLDPNYEWAVVGDPTRKYLWILSRTAQMDAAVYDGILSRLVDVHGYDLSRLNRTLQGPAQSY